MLEQIPENNQSRSIKYLSRGMTKEEVLILLTAPMNDRERAYFRGLYETTYRANELLQCDIENYNRNTGELIALHTKNKYNPRTNQHIKEDPKQAVISKSTQLLFKSIIGNRKKGPIFTNAKGNRVSKTFFEMCINEIATKIGIQKVTHLTPSGKEYHLVTLKALREAGERHMDTSGADAQVTARGAQHSAFVKEKYYKKSNWEEFQEQQKKYHPGFKE